VGRKTGDAYLRASVIIDCKGRTIASALQGELTCLTTGGKHFSQ
jgi:hypothetical protein